MPVDSNAWTTLALVKEHLQITDSSKDDWLTNLINRSHEILEKYIGRKIMSRTYTDERYDGDGTDELLVRQWPIVSVTSLYDDPARDFGADSLFDADDFVIYSDDGAIRLVGEETVFSIGKQNIKITYVAGYTSIPEDLEIASTIHVAFMYNLAGAEGHLNLSLGGFSKSYEQAPLPAQVKLYVEPYRRRPV